MDVQDIITQITTLDDAERRRVRAAIDSLSGASVATTGAVTAPSTLSGLCDVGNAFWQYGVPQLSQAFKVGQGEIHKRIQTHNAQQHIVHGIHSLVPWLTQACTGMLKLQKRAFYKLVWYYCLQTLVKQQGITDIRVLATRIHSFPAIMDDHFPQYDDYKLWGALVRGPKGRLG